MHTCLPVGGYASYKQNTNLHKIYIMEDSEKKIVKAVESEKWFIEKTYNHIMERMSGSFLPAFITSFVVVNWQFFYITFFVSEEYIYKWTARNKFEYIYFHYSDFSWLYPTLFVWAYYFIIPLFDEIIEVIKYILSTNKYPNWVKWFFWNSNFFRRWNDYEKIKDLLQILYHVIYIKSWSNIKTIYKKEINEVAEEHLDEKSIMRLPWKWIIKFNYKDRWTLFIDWKDIIKKPLPWKNITLTYKWEYILDKRIRESEL